MPLIMEDIIVKLLKENGRIIVPEFGAFIIKTKSPLKAIFNEFLQYNDGALIGAIAEQDNTDRNNAANKVKEYVDSLTSKLNSGENIIFPEIGALSKSSTGKISLGEDSSKQDNIPVPPADSSNIVDFDDSTKKSEPTIIKQPEPEKPKTEPIIKPQPPKEVFKQPTIEKKPEPAPKPVSEPESSPISEYYGNDSSSRNKKKVILWVVLIFLVNALIVSYFIFNDQIKSIINKDKDSTIEATIETPAIMDEVDTATADVSAPTDTTAVDTEPVIEQAMEEPVEEPVEPNREFNGKKYYVVAGVFSVESNADNMVTSLREKGYNAEKFGKIGSSYAVSFDVFPTKQEADRLMLKVKREQNLDAWIKVID